MRVVVDFQDEALEFDVEADRVVAAWSGPPGIDPSSVGRVASDALESPIDFPRARQMVVPGDRVVIAWIRRSLLPGLCWELWSRSWNRPEWIATG